MLALKDVVTALMDIVGDAVAARIPTVVVCETLWVVIGTGTDL